MEYSTWYLFVWLCGCLWLILCCQVYEEKSVNYKSKAPQNKFYFWSLLFGILILYVFEFQTEKKTWTIGGI